MQLRNRERTVLAGAWIIVMNAVLGIAALHLFGEAVFTSLLSLVTGILLVGGS